MVRPCRPADTLNLYKNPSRCPVPSSATLSDHSSLKSLEFLLENDVSRLRHSRVPYSSQALGLLIGGGGGGGVP